MSPKCYFRYRGKRGWKLTGDKDVCVGCRTRFGSVVVNLHFNPHLLFERKGGPVWCLMGGKCLGVTVVASRNDKRVDSCVHNNVECSCICFYFKIDLDALCWGCIGLWWILARKLRRRQGWLDEISREDCFLVIFYTILYYPYHRISPPSSFGTPHSSCGPPFHCICTKESLPCSDRNGDYCRRCPNNNNKRPDKQLSIVCQTIYLKILWAQSQEQADWTILARFPSLLVFLARGWKW